MIRKFVSFSAVLYASSLLNAFIGVALKSFIAKTVGKEALGAYSYLASLMIIGSSVLTFGLGRTLPKQVAAARGDRRHDNLVVAAIAALAVLSVVLIVTASLGNGWLAKSNKVYPFALAAVGPAALFQMARSVLRGYLDRNREATATFIAALLRLMLVSLAVYLVGGMLSPVVGLLATHLILAAGMLIYLAYRYRGSWKPSVLLPTYKGEFLDLITLAVPLWTADVLEVVGRQADRVIVQGQLGYAPVAEYAAAFTFMGLLNQPLSVMSRMFLVTFASGFYNHVEQYRRIVSANMVFITTLSLLACIAATLFTSVLFTDEYHLVPLLTAILSTSYVFKSVEMLNTVQTIVINYPQANRNATLWSTALYLPVAYLLTRYFGVIGAAVSSVFSAACYTLIHIVLMKRRLPDHAAQTLVKIGPGLLLYGATLGLLMIVPVLWGKVMLVALYPLFGHLIRLWDVREFVVVLRRLFPGILPTAR